MISKELKLVALVAFFFVVVAGIALQLVVLPMTPWHAGNGLMAGGDAPYFHLLAIDLAEKVRQVGWSIWVPRFEGQAPASIAAVVYMLTGIEQPWVLLPLHGLLYGVASMALYSMARDLGSTQLQACAVVLPLFLFPSTAMIWGQIHKDIYSLGGILLILRFWLKVWLIFSKQRYRLKQISGELTVLALGGLLVNLVRPYLVEVVLMASLLLAGVMMIFALTSRRGKSNVIDAKDRSLKSLFSIFILAVLGISVQIAIIWLERSEKIEITQKTEIVEIRERTERVENIACPGWVNTWYLPVFLDRRVASISCARTGFITGYPFASSNIDQNVVFNSAIDIVNYLPRALQISLFSPFPNYWVSGAAQSSGQFMRLMIIPEMLVLYIGFPGIIFLLVKSKTRIPSILVLIFSIAIVWIHALAITNVGTLYRMRFPSMIVWVMMGAVGWIDLFNSYLRKEK